MTKAFWKSKTLWFNFLTIIMVFAGALGYTPNAELAENVGALLIAFSPFINFLLRAFTEKKLGVEDKE